MRTEALTLGWFPQKEAQRACPRWAKARQEYCPFYRAVKLTLDILWQAVGREASPCAESNFGSSEACSEQGEISAGVSRRATGTA